jgi:hypothetical protein
VSKHKNADPSWSLRAAARFYAVDPRTLLRHALANGAAHRVGRTWRIDRTTLLNTSIQMPRPVIGVVVRDG